MVINERKYHCIFKDMETNNDKNETTTTNKPVKTPVQPEGVSYSFENENMQDSNDDVSTDDDSEVTDEDDQSDDEASSESETGEKIKRVSRVF